VALLRLSLHEAFTGPQWQVHRFYRPAERLTKDELITHRQLVTNEEPTLPTEAGKGYARMRAVFHYALRRAKGSEQRFHYEVMRQAATQTSQPYLRTRRRLRIGSVMHPEIHMDAYVPAVGALILELARKEERRQQERGH